MAKIELSTNKSNSEGGVLAKLWEKIIVENNYLNSLDMLVNKYVRTSDILSNNKSNEIKRLTRSSLIANITATDMTFKVFMTLLFKFLCVKKVTISVMLTFSNGEESVHTVSVANADIDDDTEKGADKNAGQDSKSNT